MTIFVLLTVAVMLGGVTIAAGEIIELPEKSALALIGEGKAERVTPDEGTTAALSQDAGGQNPPQSPGEGDNSPDNQNAPEGQPGGLNDAPPEGDEAEKVFKAIDAQYKRDELAEAAKLAGVDFAYDAKKGDIIQAAIDQGKAAAILK